MHFRDKYVWNENWPVAKELARLTNITLVNTASKVATKSDEQFNLMMAFGKLPDIVGGNDLKDNFIRLGMEGAFLPLNDLIDQHAPHLKAFLEQNPDITQAITGARRQDLLHPLRALRHRLARLVDTPGLAGQAGPEGAADRGRAVRGDEGLSRPRPQRQRQEGRDPVLQLQRVRGLPPGAAVGRALVGLEHLDGLPGRQRQGGAPVCRRAFQAGHQACRQVVCRRPDRQGNLHPQDAGARAAVQRQPGRHHARLVCQHRHLQPPEVDALARARASSWWRWRRRPTSTANVSKKTRASA